MPTYIMLSSLGPDGAARVVEKPDRIYEVNAEVEAMGVTVIAQYATLGAFDFVNIIEAPDEKTMARVAMSLASRGTLKTQTLTSIPVDEFVEALKTT
ncbi:MAG: GYD domain-containing protein [Acidimicrobiales bacterium]|nr:GYD domain-containing protein [Acidimicrobiales bacterium]